MMASDYVPPVRLLTAYRYKDDEFIMVIAEIKVPISVFKQSGDGTIADPNDLGVTDDGHTLRLGNYEAAGDAILEAVALPEKGSRYQIYDMHERNVTEGKVCNSCGRQAFDGVIEHKANCRIYKGVLR